MSHSSTLAEGTTDYAGEVHVIHCVGACLHLHCPQVGMLTCPNYESC